MKIDGKAVRAARRTRTHGEIAATLRWLPNMRHADQTWISMCERGLISDLREAQATALAAALGVPLSDIAENGEVPGLVDDLEALHALYGAALRRLGVTGDIDEVPPPGPGSRKGRVYGSRP